MRRERLFSTILVGIVVCSLVLGHMKIAQGTDVNPSDGIVKGVWRIVDSPFHVKRDVTVPTDESLTIEPGVAVYFDGPYRLTVLGRLIAAGTHGSRITFAWKDVGTDRNKWLGIYLKDTARPSTVSYCKIMNAIVAITAHGSSNNVFSFNTVQHNSAGILMIGSEGNTVTDNEINDNTDYGICLRQGCKRNEISRNTVSNIGRPTDPTILNDADSTTGWSGEFNSGPLTLDPAVKVQGTASIMVPSVAIPPGKYNATVAGPFPPGWWDLTSFSKINFHARRTCGVPPPSTSGRFEICEASNWRSWSFTWPTASLTEVSINLLSGYTETRTPPNLAKIDKLRFTADGGVAAGDKFWIDYVTGVGRTKGEGIKLTGSSGTLSLENKIKDNTIYNCHFSGISVDHVENLEITGNLFYANFQKAPLWNGTGGNIYLRRSNDTYLDYENKDIVVHNNKIHSAWSAYKNGTGIFIQSARNVRITYNDIYLNAFAGIVVGSKLGNVTILCQIYRNDIRNNRVYQAWDNGTTIAWDDGSRGNYWSGYNGADKDNDGIGDRPYMLGPPKDSKDNFPLMSSTLFIVRTISTSTTITSTSISTSYALTTTRIDTTTTAVTTTLQVTSMNYIWTASTGTTETSRETYTTSTSTTTTITSISTWLTTTSTTMSTATTLTTTQVQTITPRRCLIASAAFGSELEPEVQYLREFRDGKVASSYAGSNFMKMFNTFYYSFSPAAADVISSSPEYANTVRVLLYPMIGVLRFASLVSDLFVLKPEIEIVAAGIIASGLIGVAYLLPIAFVFSYLIRTRERKNAAVAISANLTPFNKNVSVLSTGTTGGLAK